MLILMADEIAKISPFAPLWRSYHIFTYSVGVVVGVHTSQALGESTDLKLGLWARALTSRMTSSKSVLQQRHLLCYESEPIH